MKRFVLFIVAAMMTALSFAQAPTAKAAVKQLTKEQMVQARNQKPEAKKLTANQRQHVIGMMKDGKMMLNKKGQAPKKALKVSHNLNSQTAVQQSKLNARKLDAQKDAAVKNKLKFVQKSGKKAGAAKAPRKVGSTTPTEAPEGLETETYSMMGFSYYTFGQVKHDVQVGFDGNDVYVKGLFEQAPDTWVKGVKNGENVTFAQGQYIGSIEAIDNYDGSSLGFMDTWLVYSSDMESYEDLVLRYNEETRVMSDLSGGFLFLATDDDFNALDAIKSLTLSPSEGEASTDLITPPASAEQLDVDVNYTLLGGSDQKSAAGRMAIDGNDIYVAGLCPDWGASWVKGTLGADGTVTFPTGQYVGNYMNVYDIYFTSISAAEAMVSDDPSLLDAKAVWNAEEKSLIFDKDCWIVENAGSLSLMYYAVLTDVEVWPSEGGDRGLVFPPAGLETKTYKTTVASLGNYSYAKGSYSVNIGFDGDDVYMQGLLFFASTSWIKGTRNADGSLTFAKNQYIGTVQGYDTYVVPCSDEDEDNPAEIYDTFTFTYDAAKDTYYYIKQNTNISFSVAPDCTDAVEIVFNVVMKGPGAPEEEEINTDVIYDQPEGELKTYTRGGGAYYSLYGMYLVETTQGGTSINIVTNGNDVYMENPISQGQVEGGTWVKGTLEGNKIHMPVKQCILYDEYEGYGYMTAAMRPVLMYDEDYDEEYVDYVLTDDTEVVFTINEDGTITMDHQSEIDPETGLADWIYGLAFTDDKSWAQIGDFNSVYTPFAGEYATIPEGLETETWAFMYNDENGYSTARLVDVAVDGDKMYIAGMSEYDKDAAMVGTIAGDKVTFASDQYIGMNSGYIAYGVFANLTTEYVYDEYYDEYFEMTGFEYLPEYSFTYDVENKMMTSAEDVAFVVNAGKGEDEILYITYCSAPAFNYFEEVAATPADPEFLAYEDWFDGYGYDLLVCNIKLEDVNGKYINQDKVYYIIWTKIDGEVEPFVFYADEYFGFAEYGIEELTEIPVNFESFDAEGYQDIAPSGSSTCIYQTGFDDYGVQTIYYGGGERRESNIVWWNNGETDGIKDVNANAGAQKQMYDLQGRKLQKLQKGINIVNVNGKNMKVLVK